MAWDAYMTLGEEVKGESQRAGHEGEIELVSFSFGAENPSNIGVGGGAAAGKVSLSTFNIMKKTDAASVGMFRACCLGQHFPTAKVSLYKASGADAMLYLCFEFEQLFCESIRWSGAEGGDGGDDIPMESAAFAFGKVKVTYTQQDETGSPVGDFVGSWNVVAGNESF